MSEPLQCPGCSTRYALRAERVRVGIRRAQCFRCSTIFDVADAVARLLDLPEPAPAAAPVAFIPVEPAPVPVVLTEPEIVAEPAMSAAEAEETVATAPEAMVTGDLSAYISLPDFPDFPGEPADANPAPPPAEPSLTLNDLEGADEEILEKTLTIAPPVDDAASTASGAYSSAKDAIARLMGNEPAAAAAPTDRRKSAGRDAMDVEATLNALEDTLSGVQSAQPAEAELAAAAPAPSALAMEAAAETVPGMVVQDMVSTSTLKLSSQEIQAAMANFGRQAQAAAPAAPAPMPAAPVQAMVPSAPPAPPAPLRVEPVSQDANLLKVQLETETVQNVTQEQVMAWIEQGRVHEYHLVARQFSEHWIEASKVPALRTVFDRLRRADGATPSAGPADAHARKGIFGGLFGRS